MVSINIGWIIRDGSGFTGTMTSLGETWFNNSQRTRRRAQVPFVSLAGLNRLSPLSLSIFPPLLPPLCSRSFALPSFPTFSLLCLRSLRRLLRTCELRAMANSARMFMVEPDVPRWHWRIALFLLSLQSTFRRRKTDVEGRVGLRD